MRQHGIFSKHKWKFRTLKVELNHGKNYNTCHEAKMAIFEYIEVFYNGQSGVTPISAISAQKASRERIWLN
jgi:hypothetical protein